MKLLDFSANGKTVKPLYCSLAVEKFLPFEHGRVRIEAGEKFTAKVENGRTVMTVKCGAGAREEPAFKVDFPSACRDAIKALRVAACHTIHQSKASS